MVIIHENPLQIKNFHNIADQSLEEGPGNELKSEASVPHYIHSLLDQLFNLFKSSVQEIPEEIEESHIGEDQLLRGISQVEISTLKLTNNINSLISDKQNKSFIALLQFIKTEWKNLG
jgi:hypothetical protein